MGKMLAASRAALYRAFAVLMYFALFAMITLVAMIVLAFSLESVLPKGPRMLYVLLPLSLLPASIFFYLFWRGMRWRVEHPAEWAADRAAKDAARLERSEKGNWLTSGATSIAVGSLGPLNFYFLLTDPKYVNDFSNWRVVILAVGAWMLFGLLFMGIATLWLGGFKRAPDWQDQANKVFERWSKLGIWLVGIAIGLGAGAIVLLWLWRYLGSLSNGTILIAVLLFMILLALWRISDQLRHR